MFTVRMTKILFGVFALSAGLAWILIGAAISDATFASEISLPILWYVISTVTVIGGLLTAAVGVFTILHTAREISRQNKYERDYESEYEE